MKQKGKDRRRRQRADVRWKERTRRKAQRKEERSRARQGGRKYAWRRGTIRPNPSSKEAQRQRAGEELLLREKRLEQRDGRGTRVRNRCVVTGNGRSVRRWFRRSGRKVRERGRRGKLQGVFKASW
jgi:small subunit ribosomal protein S14